MFVRVDKGMACGSESDFILGLLIVCNIHFLGHSLA